MTQSSRTLFKAATVLLVWIVSASGCQAQGRPETRTATPTYWVNRETTPETTATPLFRASRVSGAYDQALILYRGDTFILDNLQNSVKPISFDQNILQLISDPSGKITEPKKFRAVKPGTTEITTTILPPCPMSPVGCQPPLNVTLVVVTVYDPNQATITP